MLTRTRLAVFSPFLALLLFAFPAGAQIHGVPPSVTSFGFGGSNNPTPGIPASVTSLGPLGWDCCSGPFIAPFRFDGHRFQKHHRFVVGEMTPAVVPYFVPYAVPYEDYAVEEYNRGMESAYSRVGPDSERAVAERGPWYREVPVTRYAPAEGPSDRKADLSSVAPEPAVEVAPLPATVLVYKDGHKREVQNYAILGDTLFDFAGDRSHKIQLADLDLAATRKTNDDRGIEFRIPGDKDSGQ